MTSDNLFDKSTVNNRNNTFLSSYLSLADTISSINNDVTKTVESSIPFNLQSEEILLTAQNLVEQSQNIILFGTELNDSLLGSLGKDILGGKEGEDLLEGRDNEDLLLGGTGNDRLLGEEGDDHLRGQQGNDSIDGGEGKDFVVGHQGDDYLHGNLDNDLLFGGAGKDTLFGGAGDDLIYGHQGEDILFGGSGKDTLWGREKDSSGYGEEGNIFVLDDSEGYDLIKDFQLGKDKVGLLGELDFNDLTIVRDSQGTKLKITQTDQVLGILDRINSQDLTNDDFINHFSSEQVDIVPPTIDAYLLEDTGIDSLDNLTSNPTIEGRVTDDSKVLKFQAKISSLDSEEFVDITSELKEDGSFTLNPTRLVEINQGNSLTDGDYTLNLIASDEAGNESIQTPISFTLDTTAPNAFILNSPQPEDKSIEVVFNESVTDDASVAGNYILTIVGGDNDEENIAIASVTPVNGNTVKLDLASALGTGNYQLEIKEDIQDIAGNTVNTVPLELTTIYSEPIEITPFDGEEMVTLTRETIVRFGKKVDPETVTNDSFYAIANGSKVAGRIVVSSTEEFATLFYDEPLPQSTEVRVVVEGDSIIGRDGFALDGDEDGSPGGQAIADFTTLPLTQIEGTDVYGYVYDSYNRNPDGSDIPLKGVKITLDSLPDVTATTDENGYFILEDVPAPEFYVYIDGSEVVGAAAGTKYASLGKAFHSVPGEAIQLEMDGAEFDIYLPSMAESDVVQLSSIEDTEVGFGEASLALLQENFPDIDPEVWARTQVTYPAGSAQNDNGEAATQAMIVPVEPNRLPAPLPPHVDPQLIISIQAGSDEGFNRELEGGATNFDIPAPVQFPNLEGLAPGEKSLIWSFNHDAGDWEVIGTGTVSEDGTVIVSDEGVGIEAPGWHFVDDGSCGGSGDDPSPPPVNDSDVVPERKTEAYLSVGENDNQFPLLEWQGENHRMDRGACSRDDAGKKQTEVEIEIKGPIKEFMRQGEGTNQPLRNIKFTVTESSGKFSFRPELKSFEEMASVLGGTKDVPFAALENNILYGSEIVVTETEKDGDIVKKITETTYNLYRLINATDDNYSDGIIQFEDALASQGSRQKDIEFRQGSARKPSLEVSGSPFKLEDGNKIIFEPKLPASHQLDLTVTTLNGVEAGKIGLAGDARAKPNIFIDPDSFIEVLEEIVEYSKDLEIDSNDPNKEFKEKVRNGIDWGFHSDEISLFDTSVERNFLFSSIKNKVTQYFEKFDVLFVSSETGNVDGETVKVTFSTESSGRLGETLLFNNQVEKIQQVVDKQNSYSETVNYFRLDQAVNITSDSTIFLDNHLEKASFIFDVDPHLDEINEFTYAVAKTITHEIGHAIGLFHFISPSMANSREIMLQGLNADRESFRVRPGLSSNIVRNRAFIDSKEALQVALNGDWEKEEGKKALSYYSKVDFELKDHSTNDSVVLDNIVADRSIFEEPKLTIFDDSTSLLVDNIIDLGVVNVDGTGNDLSSINLQLVNFGSEDIILDNLALSEDNPSITLDEIESGTTIPSGESINVNLTFDPQTTGEISTNLLIKSNDPQATEEIILKGFGRNPEALAKVEITNNNLGGVSFNGEAIQSNEIATITNHGNETLTISEIEIVEGSESFTLSEINLDLETNPIQLEFGESFTIDNLDFEPSKVGLHKALIKVTSNDPNNPVITVGTVATGLPEVVYPEWGNDYVAIEFPNLLNSFPLRTVSDDQGDFEFVLPTSQSYHMTIFDPVTGLVSNSYGTTAPSGGGIDLTESLVFDASFELDKDFDGLTDDIEFALGTTPHNSDSDGDGINDLAEIEQGLNPLEGRGFPTGVIANLPLFGEAREIVVEGSIEDNAAQTAYVATGFHGLAIVDSSQFDNPIVRGQLNLSGNNIDVAVDNSLEIAAVAGLYGGLHLVDVSDPMLPTLMETIDFNASQLDIFDGIVYAASGDNLKAFDLFTGEEIQSVILEHNVNDITLFRNKVYVLTSSDLEIYENNFDEGIIQLSSLPVTRSTSPLEIGRRLFISDNFAYVGSFTGYSIIDINDPINPQLIAFPSETELAVHDLVTNGSGLVIPVTSFAGEQTLRLSLYDGSDSTDVSQFITSIDTPGAARAVAVASGLASVADGSGGLTVVNYLPFDDRGVAPTVDISSVDLDKDTEEVEITEGSTVPIQVDVSDDVQVRNVELLVNDQVVANDVSFPFDFNAIALGDEPNDTSATVQIRATDTGGNTALSNLLTLNLVPDTFAPEIVNIQTSDRTVEIRFNEALDSSLVTVESFQLTDSGGNSISPVNFQLRGRDRIIQLVYKNLEPGDYNLAIQADTIADLAGNILGNGLIIKTFSSSEMNLADLDGRNGFVLNGINSSNESGSSVSGIEDINGDGFADIIIGADNTTRTGEAYVVFGKASGFAAKFNLSDLDGSNKFVINSITGGDDKFGHSVSGAGDFNGDGFADIIIGANFADPNGNFRAGESYVVFGKESGFSAKLNLANLDGSNGFILNGIDSGDRSGVSVSGAGDVNRDGLADLIIGAKGADTNGNYTSGESYVVFGRKTT